MSSVDHAPPPDVDEAAEPVLARSNKIEESEMDITPMIDMTFLLLIFFIVTSKIRPDSGVELPRAERGTAVATKDSIILTVGPGDSFATVYKGTIDSANRISANNVEEQEEAVVAYVEAAASSGKKTAVLIQAGKGLKHRDVSRIARAAARAEIPNLYVGVIDKK